MRNSHCNKLRWLSLGIRKSKVIDGKEIMMGIRRSRSQLRRKEGEGKSEVKQIDG